MGAGPACQAHPERSVSVVCVQVIVEPPSLLEQVGGMTSPIQFLFYMKMTSLTGRYARILTVKRGHMSFCDMWIQMTAFNYQLLHMPRLSFSVRYSLAGSCHHRCIVVTHTHTDTPIKTTITRTQTHTAPLPHRQPPHTNTQLCLSVCLSVCDVDEVSLLTPWSSCCKDQTAEGH